MAYLPSYKSGDEEDAQKKAAQPLAGTSLLGASGGGVAASHAGVGPASPGAQGGPTGYVNFGQYVDANKSVSNREAGKLGDTASDQGIKATNAINGAQTEFNRGLQQGNPFNYSSTQWAGPAQTMPGGQKRSLLGSTGANQGAKQVAGTYAGLPGITPYAQSYGNGTTSTAPSAVHPVPVTTRSSELTGTPQRDANTYAPLPGTNNNGQIDIDTARQRGAATYTGPAGLANLGQLQSQAQSAQDFAKNLGNTAGIQANLNQQGAYRSNGSTNQGMDAALLGNAGGSRYEQLQKQFGGLVDYLGKASNNATNAATNMTNQVGAQAANYRDAAAAYDADAAQKQAQEKAAADADAKAAAQQADDSSYWQQNAGTAQQFGMTQAVWNSLTPEERAAYRAKLDEYTSLGPLRDANFNLSGRNPAEELRAMTADLAKKHPTKYGKGKGSN